MTDDGAAFAEIAAKNLTPGSVIVEKRGGKHRFFHVTDVVNAHGHSVHAHVKSSSYVWCYEEESRVKVMA